MQIIKDKQIVANEWTFIANDSDIPPQGNITVTLERWKNEHSQLLNRTDKCGVRLIPGDNILELNNILSGAELVELDFLGFGDGRLFSHARLLRSRLGYQGELRAVGHFLADQVFYLMRVGVNAFFMENQQQIPLALDCMNDFTVTYQPSTL